MSENLKSRIYKHGSMPPFMLEFSGPDLRNIDQTCVDPGSGAGSTSWR